MCIYIPSWCNNWWRNENHSLSVTYIFCLISIRIILSFTATQTKYFNMQTRYLNLIWNSFHFSLKWKDLKISSENVCNIIFISKMKNLTNSRGFFYYFYFIIFPSIAYIQFNWKLNVNLFHFHNSAQFNQFNVIWHRNLFFICVQMDFIRKINLRKSISWILLDISFYRINENNVTISVNPNSIYWSQELRLSLLPHLFNL